MSNKSTPAVALEQAVKALATNVKIETAADRDNATEVMRAIRERARQWKRVRDDAIKPFQEAVNEARERWKLPLQLFESALRKTQRAIAAFEITKREEAEKALTDAAPTEVARAAELMTPRPARLQIRTTYHCEVLVPAEVPRKFCKPDQIYLNAEARRLKDQFAVPGCKLVKDVKAV